MATEQAKTKNVLLTFIDNNLKRKNRLIFNRIWPTFKLKPGGAQFALDDHGAESANIDGIEPKNIFFDNFLAKF
jgi:hypothetical protein